MLVERNLLSRANGRFPSPNASDTAARLSKLRPTARSQTARHICGCVEFGELLRRDAALSLDWPFIQP
jgi:hypothetical protein